MTNNSWGKFTVRGSEDVEKKIMEIMKEVAFIIESQINPNNFTALIMLGGYGRGEGGVVIFDGKEYPHNNFDFLLITRNLNKKKQNDLKKKIYPKLIPLNRKIKTQIDLGIVNASNLKHTANRIIWYDMRFGHKTILGDENFVPSLRRFRLQTIPKWDARNLLVNRGTLMIINELLLKKKNLDNDVRKLIIKHINKAIIGYGDALLFFLNDYNWSYVEKQKRMQNRNDVSEDFKKIYDKAMEFRFQPKYENYMRYDYIRWMEELKSHFEYIHKYCEAQHLGKPEIDWNEYPEIAFKRAFFERSPSVREFLKKFINIFENKKYQGKGSLFCKLGFKTLDSSGVLAILFPLIAYNLKNKNFMDVTSNFLNSPSTSIEDLRRSYIKAWMQYRDNALQALLHKHKIYLDSSR
ncbi:MAG: hypothetical protein HQ534_09480 [Armatimonadetes bacterium]|nr:hypothetical protein [Armatimonadota bacterium]